MNIVLLVGNLGNDPDLKYVGHDNYPIATFSLATKETRKGKNGEVETYPEWHTIKVFGKSAENCKKYLAKGRPVSIEGKNCTESWEKDGVKRYSTKVYASRVEFLGGGQDQRAGQQPQQNAPGPEMGGDHYPGPPMDTPGLDNVPF